MTAVVTNFFRQILFDSLDKTPPLDPTTNLMNGRSVHWVYFATSPTFDDPNDPRYVGIRTVADLQNLLGWGDPIAPPSETQPVGTQTVSGTTYVIANNPFDHGAGWETSNVVTAALVLEGTHSGTTDPIIYLTDTPFDSTVMRPGDRLTARPDPGIGGNRWLLSWPVFVVGAPTVLPVEGPLVVLAAPPDFEMSQTVHAWLYPQRVNMVPNPSFEGGTNHWRSTGAVSRINQGAPGGGAWSGTFAAVNGIAVAESAIFPLLHQAAAESKWTIQAMVRASAPNCQLRVALLQWPYEFDETGADWGDKEDYTEIWNLSSSGYEHIYALRDSAENAYGAVRMECRGGNLIVDNVCCEPDWLRYWPYFDGDANFGARDDYSWYGGENLKGRTYSLWYNHRRAVLGRLFSWDISDEDFTVTDEEIEAQGFVYKWVPAGVRVVPHLDVLRPNDPQQPPEDNAGSPAIAYRTTAADVTGVENPWAATQFLDPSVGAAQTADAADLNISADTVWVMRVQRTDAWAANTPLFGKATTGDLSWLINYISGGIHMYYSTTAGTGAGGFPASPKMIEPVPATVIPEDEISYFAVYIQRVVSGSTIGRALISSDGEHWTAVGIEVFGGPAFTTIWDSAAPITVGRNATGPEFFPGRIYWVEQRTGIDPNAGTVRWRFDAREYPGQGTSYTDPRGRVWTVPAGAIKSG